MSRSPSPLASKTKPKTSSIKPIPKVQASADGSDLDSGMEEQSDQDDAESDEVEEWDSPVQPKAGSSKHKQRVVVSEEEDEDSDEVQDLEEDMGGLNLGGDSRDSMATVAGKQPQKSTKKDSSVAAAPKVVEAAKKKR